MMKILFINPPNSVEVGIDFDINVYQPIGLASVAAVLEKEGHKVAILDALAEGFPQEWVQDGRRGIGLSYPEIQERIENFNPGVVGLSVPFSFQSYEAHRVAVAVKKVNPKVVTMVGGAHATIQPEEVLADRNVDFVVLGEGEDVTLTLIQALESGKDATSLTGLAYRKEDGSVIVNQRREVIRDLDRLPFPARHLLPMEKYFAAARRVRVTEGLAAYGKRWTSIITSRGCPFSCTFCTVHLTMTRIWRARSPQNVVAEIADFVRKFGIQYFDILDDNFTLVPERAKEICRLLIEKNIRVQWSTPNGIRADRLDEELLRLMKGAGCVRIKVAPESGSQEILDNVIKKKLDLGKVKEVVAICKKIGLPVEAFFVVGFPEETEKDIRKTINFAKELRRLGCEFCYFFIATPYFGTELYRNAVAHGYLDEEHYQMGKLYTVAFRSLLRNPHLTAERFATLLKEARRINPLITPSRLGLVFYLMRADPLRVLQFLKKRIFG